MAEKLEYSPKVKAYITASAMVKTGSRLPLAKYSKADRDAINAELDKISDRLIKSAQKIHDGEQYKKVLDLLKQKEERNHAGQ